MLTFTTARLAYRQLTQEDWPFFLSLQRDETVMRYMADQGSEEEIYAAFSTRLPVWSPESRHWLGLLISDKASGEPVGVTGFIRREEDKAEVGYLLAKRHHGLGYGYESLRAVCDLAFKQCGIRKLVATVTEGNVASLRLLEKVGFQLEGTLRENYFLQGRWQDDWVFGLLNQEYC